MTYKQFFILLLLIPPALPGNAYAQGADIPLGVAYGQDNTVYVVGSSATDNGDMKMIAYVIYPSGMRDTVRDFMGLGSILPSGMMIDGEHIIALGTERLTQGAGMLLLRLHYPLVSVEQLGAAVAGFALSQSYPNPVGASNEAVIEFTIPTRTSVRLSVVSITGEEVALLEEGTLAPGQYRTWFSPSTLPSGTYFYVLAAGDQSVVRKLIVSR